MLFSQSCTLFAWAWRDTVKAAETMFLCFYKNAIYCELQYFRFWHHEWLMSLFRLPLMFIINTQDLLFAAWKNSQKVFHIDFHGNFQVKVGKLVMLLDRNKTCTTLFFDTTYVLEYYNVCKVKQTLLIYTMWFLCKVQFDKYTANLAHIKPQ